MIIDGTEYTLKCHADKKRIKKIVAAKRRERRNKFKTGKAHIFNPVPKNEEEALQHGNALAASGNYPVGTSECFNVGISGGCGPECFVYLKGACGEPQEMPLNRSLSEEQIKIHNRLYKK